MTDLYDQRSEAEADRDELLVKFNKAIQALDEMCKEFRALDLPYGSSAYHNAINVLNRAQE